MEMVATGFVRFRNDLKMERTMWVALSRKEVMDCLEKKIKKLKIYYSIK